MKRIHLLLVACALATAGAVLLATKVGHEVNKPAPTVASAAPAPFDSNAASLPPGEPNTVEKTADQSKTPRLVLLKALNASRDYRAYFHETIKSKEPGMSLYSFAILGLCKNFTMNSAVPAGAAASQLAARQTLVERCNTTEEERLAAFEQVAFARERLLANDPVFIARNSVTGADSSEAFAQAVAKVLASGDQLAMDVLVAPDPASGSTYFDGKVYGGELENARLQNAYTLARCTLGMDCGPDSLLYLKACAQDNVCGENVAEAINRSLSDNPAEQQATRRLANRMITVFTRRDVGAFLPPKR